MESHGTFRTLLNPIKQLMLRRSKLAIYGTSRSMELPTQWNFPLGFERAQGLISQKGSTDLCGQEKDFCPISVSRKIRKVL